MKSSRRRTAPFILAALVLCAAGAFALCRALAPPPAVVAYVDGVPVPLAEYQLAEARHRAGVISYFQSTYGAEYGPEFWSRDYGGETPGRLLHSRALSDCVQAKVLQGLAQQRGILPEVSFPSLMEDMEAENARRAADIEAGRVVYGASAYTPEAYYAYFYSNLALELKRSLEEDVLAWTEEELRDWYSENSASFRTEDEIVFQRISAGFAGEDQDAAAARIGRAAEELAAGRPFAEVAASFGGTAEERLNADSVRNYSKYEEAIYNAALLLEPGEITAPFEADGAYVILYCTQRTPGTLQDFGQVRAEAEVLFLNQRFDDFLQKQCEEAKTEWVG